MKNTIYSAIIALAAFFALNSTSYCSKPEDKNNGKELSVKTEQNDVKEVKKVESIKVKNIWKDMPSFDKFGNEITGKARKNMMENSAKKIKTNEPSNVTVVNEISGVK